MEGSWSRRPYLFVFCAAPPFLWLGVFFFAPIALIVAFSFGEQQNIIDIAVTGTLDNYVQAVDPLYLRILMRSVLVVGVVTVICFVIGLPMAIGIAFAPTRWKAWLLLLVILPFWTNLLIRTYALIAVLRTRGHINTVIEWLWLKLDAGLAWIGFGEIAVRFVPLPLLYNDFAVIFGLVYIHLPFMVLPLYAALENLDRALIEAGLDLGDRHPGVFYRIVLPLIRPGIYAAIAITFIPALGSFLIPDLLGGTDSQLIANVIERQFKSANDWPFGAALASLLMAVTFIAVAFRARRGGGSP